MCSDYCGRVYDMVLHTTTCSMLCVSVVLIARRVRMPTMGGTCHTPAMKRTPSTQIIKECLCVRCGLSKW